MSGGIISNRFQALALAVFISVASLVLGDGVYAATTANTGSQSTKSASAAKVASANKVAGSTKTAKTQIPVNAAHKTPTPPPIAGVQKVASPDAAKSLVPDAAKLVSSAKTRTEMLAELEKAKAKVSGKKAVNNKKKNVKTRKIVVNAQVSTWASRASDAESLTYGAARKLVGDKRDFLTKESVFLTDKNGRIACLTNINFTDLMPENWYLETEMTVGFGSTYERAYGDAMERAFMRVKKLRSGDWIAVDNSARNASDLGVIPYAATFSTSGKEVYCKLYFRYFMPRE